MSLSLQQLLTMKQTIEVLAGERGDPEKAAIRMIYLKQLQDLVTRISMQANGIQSKIVVLDQNLQTTQQTIAFIQSDVDDLSTDVLNLQADLATVQSGLGDANADLAQLNSDIASIQIAISNLATLESDVDTLQTNVSTLQTNVSSLQTGQSNLSNEVSEIKSDVTLVNIPTMQQGNVSAAPTAAEFNTLVADVTALRTALSSLKTAIM